MRANNRQADELREVTFTRHYTCHAEGSVLVEFGRTRILCNASIEPKVPAFLKGKGKGWLTAEYGMLPRATHGRMRREAAQSKQAGRTVEIQRLIGRCLRAAVDLKLLAEKTIIMDCDVLQADGGTRTAAITGAYIALVDAVKTGMAKGMFTQDPIIGPIAAISVGVCEGTAVLDLDYAEDAIAETDMNLVMNGKGEYIEIQGTAEGQPFSAAQLERLLAIGSAGIARLIALQQEALST